MKNGKRILLILFIAIPALLLCGSLFLAGSVMTGKRQTEEEAMAWQSERYDTSFYQTIDKTEYTVTSEDGYLLHAELLKNPERSEKYVILSHGYTDNRIGSLKYVQMYLDLGYNCVIYDLRGHGKNQETFTTYGIREGRDIAAMVQDTRVRYPNLTILGLHGESLGAASTISSLQYHPQVDFVVADCAFSDIDSVLRNGYRNAHIPVFLADLADFGARLRYHYALKDMRPIDALDGSTVPILFIHGEEDSLIPPQNSTDMYERTKGNKDILIVQGAEHAKSILTDPEGYRQKVETFLEIYCGEQRIW